jgi:hypothetical protein
MGTHRAGDLTAAIAAATINHPHLFWPLQLRQQ